MSISDRKFRHWLAIILLIGGGLRLYGLGAPSEMMFDETHYVPSAEIMAGVSPHPGMGGWASHPLIGRSPDTNFSHPPLGKLLIASGIVVFGNHSFGWRITAALAGVLSILVMVLIARQLGLSPLPQLLCGWLIASDGLHLTISRLAMLDSFLFLFSLMAVHALLKFRSNQRPWMLVYLVASLGAAIAVKESAINVVAAVMVLMVLFGPSTASLGRRLLLSGAVGLGSLAFYGISGFYYVKNGFSPIEWVQFRAEVITKLVNPLADHRYGSHPWQWLIGQKPVWIYWKDLEEKVLGIVAVGNVFFWWLFAPVALWTCRLLGKFSFKSLRFRLDYVPNWAAVFGLIWFVSLTVPIAIMVARRVGFLYHHLPAVAAMAVVVAATADSFTMHYNQRIRDLVCVTIAALSAIQLVIFLPALLGIPMSRGLYDFIRIFTGV